MKQLFILAIALMMTVAAQAKGEKTNGQWVATWATATEFTGKGDMPKSGTLTGYQADSSRLDRRTDHAPASLKRV